MTPRPREIFFERLTAAHRPLVAWYVARGHRVFVFDFSGHLKAKGWVRSLLNRGRVQIVYIYPDSRADSASIEAAHWLYPAMERTRIVQSLNRLAGPDEVAPVLKHALVTNVFQYLFIRMFLGDRLAEADRQGSATLIPHTYERWALALRDWDEHPFRSLRPATIPWWASVWAWLAQMIERPAAILRICGLCVPVAWAGVMERLRPARIEPTPRRYDHVYAIDQSFQTKFQGPRAFSFLLDHARLSKQSTAFLVHRRAEGAWLQPAREAGYHLIRWRDCLNVREVVRHPPRRLARAGLGGALWRLACGVTMPQWLLEAVGRGLMSRMEQAFLLQRLSCRNYIYTNRDDLAQRWQNIWLRQAGVQTWCFALAIGGGYVYGKHNLFGDRHRFWAYQNPDHFVVPSRRMAEYHQSHRQAVRRYHVTGSLWSELVQQAIRQQERLELRERWFGARARQGKVIAWFDTTFIEANDSPSSYGEAIAWYRDLARLLDEDEAYLAVIKPSKDERFFADPRSEWSHPLGSTILRQWASLKRHPRVYFAGHNADPAAVIAASDLTITFCFSTPTADALGAGKRAIWYEPGERWRTTLYGADPLLTAHGYEELRQLVQKLLGEVSDEAYQRYLQGTVRGLVEDFMDGAGLTRFRTLLAEAAGNGHAGS